MYARRPLATESGQETSQSTGSRAEPQSYLWQTIGAPDLDAGCDEDVPFCDQRDNRSVDGATGDVQCSPTATTMVILAELGDGFLDVACVLFAEVGLPCHRRALASAQPEELVLRWMHARDWSSEFPGKPPEPIHQSALAMAKTIEEWTGRALECRGSRDARETLEALEALPTVVGTWLTSGGHTVTLLEVGAEGVVIHDPYGARTPEGYLRNGEAPTGAAPPAHRWQDPELLQAFADGEVQDDWGRSNHFTWAEVEQYGIGKWALGEAG